MFAETRNKIKLKLLGDPTICIVSFKIKVYILNVLAISLIIYILKLWLKK